MPINEETAAIYNLLQELRDGYSAEIQKVELIPWINELEAKNNAVDILVKSRNDEPFVRKLNLFIDKYNLIVAQREGKRAKKK